MRPPLAVLEAAARVAEQTRESAWRRNEWAARLEERAPGEPFAAVLRREAHADYARAAEVAAWVAWAEKAGWCEDCGLPRQADPVTCGCGREP